MNGLAEQFPARKVAFLICSDEPRNEQEFPGLSVEFGARSPLEDLYALAKCDYIFGPVSTFSQWASFYGNKPLFSLYDSDTRLESGKFTVSDLRELAAPGIVPENLRKYLQAEVQRRLRSGKESARRSGTLESSSAPDPE